MIIIFLINSIFKSRLELKALISNFAVPKSLLCKLLCHTLKLYSYRPLPHVLSFVYIKKNSTLLYIYAKPLLYLKPYLCHIISKTFIYANCYVAS